MSEACEKGQKVRNKARKRIAAERATQADDTKNGGNT